MFTSLYTAIMYCTQRWSKRLLGLSIIGDPLNFLHVQKPTEMKRYLYLYSKINLDVMRYNYRAFAV